MPRLRRILPAGKSHGLFKNMLIIASGNGIARLVGLATMPIITRIYLPEDLGALSLFVALTALLVPFGTLRYPVAIPLPRHPGMAANIAVLSSISLLLLTFFTTLILWFFGADILGLFSSAQLLPYWWLLPLVISGAGFYEILAGWAIREKDFHSLAQTKVWQSIAGSLVKVVLGVLAIKPLGLMIGHVVTETSGSLLLLGRFRSQFIGYSRHVTARRVCFALKRYSELPKYRLPSQCLLVFSAQAPLLFSGSMYGTETTGQLGLALLTVALPMTLFGQATSQAYFAEISRIGSRNPLLIKRISKEVTGRLGLLALPPFFTLFVGGPIIFSVAFGPAWREAGVFSSILAPYVVTQFVSAPLVNALTVFGRQEVFLYINISRALLIVLVFGLMKEFECDAKTAIGVYSIGLSFYYLLVIFIVFMIINGNSRTSD